MFDTQKGRPLTRPSHPSLTVVGRWAAVRRSAVFVSSALVLTVLCWPGQADAQESDDLRAKTQNPVGSLYSVPLENNFDFGAPNGGAYILNIQPVIPITVGGVNLINRVIIPIVSVQGFIEGLPDLPEGAPGDGATGLGDINYSLFLSPANPGKIIWGLGPSFGLRTATDAQLGSGKWTLGPTVVVLTQPKPWSMGVLLRQLWSYAGDPDRTDVSQFLVQPFVNYNLPGGWYLVSDPVITANWKAESGVWTVPLGAGFGKLFTIGSQPINSRILAFYNVARPEAAPDWALKFTIQLLFPK